MNHNKHSYLMIGLVAVGAVLFLSGATGGGLVFLLWPLACMAMMFFMMRSMGGMGQGGGTSDMGHKGEQYDSASQAAGTRTDPRP